MAANYNRVILAGNVTRDPQIRYFANDRAVADLGLAVNRRWRDRDGNQQEETTFVDCEAWGRTAELIGQYLSKGRACLVEGRLKLDQWEDQEGHRRSKLKVVADSVQFLDPPQRQEPGTAEAPAAGRPADPEQAPAAAADDEPPF